MLGERVEVAAGDTVFVRLGASEMCCALGLTNQVRPVRILAKDGFGQLLDTRGRPWSMPNPLGWMSFYGTNSGGWYSYDIVAVNVAYDPTAPIGTFCRYVDSRRMAGGTPHFELARDDVLASRAEGLAAELRFVESAHVTGYPAWVSSTVVPLDAEVSQAFSAWGGDRLEHPTVYREIKDLGSARQAVDAARRLAQRYGHGRAMRDTYLSIPGHPVLHAGRCFLLEL